MASAKGRAAARRSVKKTARGGKATKRVTRRAKARDDSAVRDHLARLLDWEDAHVGFDKAVDGIPPEARGARPAGFEHSAWQLVEHIRLAQDDILDFCLNRRYEHRMKWPDDYWPTDPVPPNEQAWADSIASYARSLKRLKQLARDVPDLTSTVPTGKGRQTYLRAVLVTADHTAYHVGQILELRRALGRWPHRPSA